jgi:hypothetical protein
MARFSPLAHKPAGRKEKQRLARSPDKNLFAGWSANSKTALIGLSEYQVYP